MKNLRLALLFFVLLILQTANAQVLNFKIIETSDLHGAIYPFDFINNKPAKASMAQIYTYVKQERDNNQQHVILLDAGDLLQGQPPVYYYNFEETAVPHLMAEVMNYMKYDAGAVGNHDIETGHNVYDKFKNDLNFPWLAANAVNTESGKPYFEPYTIITKNGVKIAVIGLITPGIPMWLPEKIWAGIQWEDMIESAEKWLKIVRDEENPDLIIGLFHSGIDHTYGGVNKNTYKNENAAQLVAEQVPGFDVVFVGHDHAGWNKFVKDETGKEVLILGPRGYASTAAAANIKMTFNESSGKWEKNISGEIIDVSIFKADEEFINKFTAPFELVKNYVSKEIGEFTETISSRESVFGASSFSDLINKIQMELTGAEISFTAPLSFDAKISKGKVYVRDMFNLYKFENYLYTMELSGQEIKDYLEYSYSNWFNQMNDENDHLLNFKKDDNGKIDLENSKARFITPAYNFDCAAGINYTVDVSKIAGGRITISGMSDGKEFNLNKKYNVAINSYRGNGGGGHLTKGAGISKQELSGRILNSTDKDLRFYMMKWIEEHKLVTPQLFGNWKVIPEDWWLKGKKKDYQLIFGNK
ncbi:MAG: bifunctional metallophosphatase/5'-nucleotidase [Bacteroidetes bacterium]|nr:bifunctional metallophosphatase/5'-nucleotidase [Bacteroidota bacterium]